jgi:hypothetical protein
VGLIKGRYLYDMHGNPVGQIRDTHVHKVSGEYVGELHHKMIVNKGSGNRGGIGNAGNPGNAGSPGNPGRRRSMNAGYADVSDEIFEDD